MQKTLKSGTLLKAGNSSIDRKSNIVEEDSENEETIKGGKDSRRYKNNRKNKKKDHSPQMKQKGKGKRSNLVSTPTSSLEFNKA